MSLPFRPLGNRVVIQADRETRAPEVTASGVLTAKTLEAAVSGEDAQDSWFVGTVVACGPLVNRFDVRPYVLKRLREKGAIVHLRHLIAEIEALPTDCADPVHVGDRVCFSWSSGQEIRVDNDRFLMMAASDVLAVLEDV